MNRILHVLLIEDNEDDAQLVVRELRNAKYDVLFRRVDTAENLNIALEAQQWDLVICDHTMPQFRGTDALRFIQSKNLDIPFIFVSGTMGEDTAVAAMKAGAQDYFVKGNLRRFVPAVERELREADARRQQKQMERDLHESEELSRAIFDTEPECVKIVSQDGKVLQINPAGAAMLEAPSTHDVIGQTVYPYVAPEHREKFHNLMKEVCAGNQRTLEFEIIGLKGTRRWLETHAVPLYTSTKELIGVLGVTRDISHRKQAEKLQSSIYHIASATNVAQTLDDLFKSVHEIVGTIMPAKNFYIALYDERSDILSFPYCVDEADTPLPPQKPGKGLTEYVLRTGTSLLCNEETDLELRKRGEVELVGVPSPIWLGVPLRIGDRTIGVMTVQHYDDPAAYGKREQEILEFVSTEVAKAIERKQSEEKISRSEEQFRLISENIADLVAVLDLTGRRIYNSPSYREILGDPESLRGTDSFEEIHPDDRDRIKQAFFDTVRTGTGHAAEFRFQARDGAVRYVESQGSVIRDPRGNVAQVLIVSRDVTDKKNTEAQMLRAQRLESIGTLAGGIAHDLNNVLAPILMGLEILRKKFPDSDSKRILDALETSATRGAGMVRQVLTFARGIEGERISLQPKHIIEEIVKIARETFPKSIHVRSDVPKDLWTMKGDPTQLHQVLLNLCVNARDAMPAGGSITISAENVHLDEHYARMHVEATAGPHIIISVADSGTGIPQDIIDKIFDPFFTTKEVGKGTGLGLSTVLAIAKSHGGFINVYSEHNKGTMFKIYLPITSSEESIQTDSAKSDRPAGQGETILVIDDEAGIREITKETLETFGYRVITANDGAEGVALYVQHRNEVKVVLTDMMMPLMSGASTIRALRKINPNIKIIAASGLIGGSESTVGPDLGVQATLTKPFTADRLLVSLHEVLNRD
ncbi:MAG TPA: PAS domain S-box protein [Bacteroidota bacterium]|nr:PAS domain S-box protein [Bacteroidota bacterium]